MKWISVKVRLPEESEKVLAYNNNFVIFFSYSEQFRFDGVTHWQPLPAPPTAKQQKSIDEASTPNKQRNKITCARCGKEIEEGAPRMAYFKGSWLIAWYHRHCHLKAQATSPVD